MISAALRRHFAACFLFVFLLIVGPPVALAAFVIFGAHQVAPPSVDSAGFSISPPLTAGETVGVVTATNVPTSWSITACSPSCLTDFAISNVGVLTVTSAGATGLTIQTYTVTVQATNINGSGNNTVSVNVVGTPYVGFLDQYPSIGATWGFSNHKLQSAANSNNTYYIEVTRASDGTSQDIGWDASDIADVTAFNAFCSGTRCAATTIYDQVNGKNATCTGVVAFIGSDGNVDIAPGPSGYCTVPYSTTYATAEQELFAVALPGTLDYRLSSPTLPSVKVTGDVSAGSTTVSSMSSQAGISPIQSLYTQGGATGVTDSAGFLPVTSGGLAQTYLSALPTGTSATLAFLNGGATAPSGTQTADTLSFTNAVLPGVWIGQGPSSGGMAASYWSMGLGTTGMGAFTSSPITVVNATTPSGVYASTVGQGMRSVWGLWDFDTYTSETWFDGTQVTGAGANTSITYSTNVPLILFKAPDSSQYTQNNVFGMMVLVNQTYSGRAAAASWLMAQYGITAPSTNVTTSDGFAWTPYYAPNDASYTNIYGVGTTAADVNGLTWAFTDGGYLWPSVSVANNINNSTTMWRFIVESGDGDMNITGAERAELAAANASVSPGQYWSEYHVVNFAQFPSEISGNGNWCFENQLHESNADTNAPSIVAIDCTRGELQVDVFPGNVQTNCGSPQTIAAGTNYAIEIDGFWSSAGGSDTLLVYFGVAGSNLTQICNTSGTLFDHDISAYPKQGIYRGDHLQNQNTIELRSMNFKFSNTQNAYASLRTGANQPPLPAHP